jgi:hypothetical protein
VVHDRVEADLGQRMAQLGRGMVECPGLVRKIGSEIDAGITSASGMISAHRYFYGFRRQNRL